MTAPRGKGFYRVVQNDRNVLVAWFRGQTAKEGGFTDYVIIEKTTGTLIDVEDIVISSSNDTPSPNVDVGHCVLIRP
jgi:hypothetical protein